MILGIPNIKFHPCLKPDNGNLPRNSKAWKELVTEAWERDNRHCLGCGKYLNRNEIAPHHYPTVGAGGKDVLSGIFSLCKSCHLKIDSGELSNKIFKTQKGVKK